MMKKGLMALMASVFLLSSCGTYTGQGAYVGGSFGSILGSAIGGISGGWRGRDVGTLVGMAGGAVVGAAIGAAADQKQAEQVEQYKRDRAQRQRRYDQSGQSESAGVYDDSGFDATNSADDRISFDGAGPTGPVGPVGTAKVESKDVRGRLEIRNIQVLDGDRNGVLRAGEECKISFEVMNHSVNPVYDVQPMVTEVTGNKRIYISPNLHVESIAPHTGIRYTASLLADKKLKDGNAVIRVGVAHGSSQEVVGTQDITIKTSRK